MRVCIYSMFLYIFYVSLHHNTQFAYIWLYICVNVYVSNRCRRIDERYLRVAI